MDSRKLADGIVAGRLSAAELADNFADLHPPLDRHEAFVAADRCYFCHDAPCVAACPTAIDIPLFIRQIATGNTLGAAKTIFEQNILGGMCARVCPTETLCEQACVREAAEGRPVRIGLLQRHATDVAMSKGVRFEERAPASGRKVAIVGAGPAGLACAHRLAVHGHDVTIFEARNKPGGLNEFGIAAYKTVDDFARAEVEYVLGIGGIDIEYGRRLGNDITLAGLAAEFDAVFLGIGLAGVNNLGIGGDRPEGLEDAVDFIARLRQAEDKGLLAIGRRVVVIGGGMTAIDAAVQAKLLGAEEVTICYRRGQGQMKASAYEQELAAKAGVLVRYWLRPLRVLAEHGRVTGIELEYADPDDGGGAGRLTLPADQVFSAIGQSFVAADLGGSALALDGGRIRVDPEGRTAMDRVWAGGDCVAAGDDLTVTAVAQGRDAAESINRVLAG